MTTPERPEGPANGRRRLLLALRISVAAVLVALIVHFVDFDVVRETLARIDPTFIAVIFAIGMLDRFVMAYKWALLVRARGGVLSNADAYRTYLTAHTVGAFLPTGVGADVFRAVRTSVGGHRLDRVSASIVMERALGVLSTATLALMGLGVLAHAEAGSGIFGRLFAGTVLFLLAALAALFVSTHDRTYRIAKRFLAPFEKRRLVRMYLALHGEYAAMRPHRGTLVVFYLLSIVEQSLIVLVNYAGAVALDLEVPFVYFLALIPLGNFVVLLPISIGGIGVDEGVFIMLFRLAGMAPGEALSVSLLVRAASWVLLLPGAGILLYESLRVRRVQDPARR